MCCVLCACVCVFFFWKSRKSIAKGVFVVYVWPKNENNKKKYKDKKNKSY